MANVNRFPWKQKAIRDTKSVMSLLEQVVEQEDMLH